jgi:hypothetical protein
MRVCSKILISGECGGLSRLGRLGWTCLLVCMLTPWQTQCSATVGPRVAQGRQEEEFPR